MQPFHSGPISIGPGILYVAPLGTTAPAGIHGGPDATQAPGANGTAFQLADLADGPALPTSATATTGGSLAPGTYGYRVSAVISSVETDVSPEVLQVVPAGTSTNTVTLTWGAVAGATAYKVYGRTANAELLIISLGNVLTYTDLGSITPAGAMPSDASGWWPVGYTADGSEFGYALTTADVLVAESLLPVRIMTTKVDMSVKFACAEMTADNIQMALNAGVGGIPVPNDPTIHVNVAPPTAGNEIRIQVAWDREDGLERMVWWRCIQAGSLAVMRKKAPALSDLPVEFKVEMPASGIPMDWRISKTLVAAA